MDSKCLLGTRFSSRHLGLIGILLLIASSFAVAPILAPTVPLPQHQANASMKSGITRNPEFVTKEGSLNNPQQTEAQTTPIQAPVEIGVIVPLYTPPSDPSWEELISAKMSNPGVPIIAIVNPDSGPGSSFNGSYSASIQELRSVGIKVVGYVATGYGSNYLSDVESQIQTYSSWYHLDGIFFDEMADANGSGSCPSACTIQQYYGNLSSYASRSGYSISIGNPGQNTVQSLKGIMKITVIYENSGNSPLATIQSSTEGFSRSAFAYIAIGVGLNSSLTRSYGDYVSWVYTTDLCTGQSVSVCNPYAGLPSYFSTLLSSLDN